MPIHPENELLRYHFHTPRSGEITLSGIILGAAMTFFGVAVGGGGTVRIPNTELNATIGPLMVIFITQKKLYLHMSKKD